MDTPLSTTQSILAATQSDPSLRYDKNLISNYQNLGGTLINGAIPTISSEPVTPKKTVSILSTENAKQDVNTNLNTLTGISPTTSPSYVPTKVETPKIETKTPTKTDTENSTFINKDTGQEYTFNSLDLENPTNQSYIKQNGLDFVSGRFPSFLAEPKTQSTGDKLSEDVAAKDKQVEDLTNQWLSYNVENDPVFQARASSITAQYDELKRAMAKQNESRMKAYQTLGIRSGTSQYASGVQMGIEGEELNQANARIAELNRQESDAISSARVAYQTGKWTEFSNKVNALQKIRDNKSDELKEYNKTLADQLKTIQEATKAQNEAIAKVEAERTKDVNDIYTTLAKTPGVPPQVLQNVQDILDSGGSLQDAVSASGNYLQSGTGIVGEYLFYKRQAEQQGQQPVDFNSYQTLDANRKAKATAGANGLPPTILAKATTIADQFKTEQTVQQYQTIAQTLAAVKGSGRSPTDDIQRVYAFAKIMDPNSAVREGEYDTVQKYAQALYSHVGLKVARVFDNTGFLTQDARDKMLTTLEGREKAVKASYDSIRNSYGSRINKITGQKDGLDYLTDYTQPTVGEELIKTNAQKEQTLTNNLNIIKTSNPKLYSAASDMYVSVNPETGQPYTADDILQAFPELNK